jgi:uncharacterized protein (DUF4415 family)
MTDEEIERNALEDLDNPPLTEEDFAISYFVWGPIRPKKAVSIRLDPAVIEYFKEQGRGYQSRINTVLMQFVDSQRRLAKSADIKRSRKSKSAAKRSK